MNHVFSVRSVASTSAPGADGAGSGVRHAALVKLLMDLERTDGDVLYPLLAALLVMHLDHDHGNREVNTRIRQSLDDLELLLALDIERLGLRRAPETPCTKLLRSYG